MYASVLLVSQYKLLPSVEQDFQGSTFSHVGSISHYSDVLDFCGVVVEQDPVNTPPGLATKKHHNDCSLIFINLHVELFTAYMKLCIGTLNPILTHHFSPHQFSSQENVMFCPAVILNVTANSISATAIIQVDLSTAIFFIGVIVLVCVARSLLYKWFDASSVLAQLVLYSNQLSHVSAWLQYTFTMTPHWINFSIKEGK